MKEKGLKKLAILLGVIIVIMLFAVPAFAATTEAEAETVVESNTTSWKAIACAIAIAIPAAVGAVSMAIATGKAADGIARQPEAASSIRTSTMLGLVFIETAIIYALLAVILIIFVL